MPLEITTQALEELGRRAKWLEGRKPFVVVYWERDSMDSRRTATGQTEWYVAKPGYWEVLPQAFDDLPLELRTHVAVQNVADYPILVEGKTRMPLAGPVTLDFANGQFTVLGSEQEL
jgi:hypothetical protein